MWVTISRLIVRKVSLLLSHLKIVGFVLTEAIILFFHCYGEVFGFLG